MTTAPASAPPLNPVNPQGLEGQVRELSAQLRALGERFEKLERIREQLAEFNFQAITVILAVLTLAIAAPIAVLHGVNPTADQLVEILDAILAADTAIALCWLVLWMRLYLKPVKS